MSKILLADNSTTMQKVVDLVLKEEGYTVKAVGNGEQAMKELAAFGPDLVLAYIKLPGMNGYEISRAIKSDPGTSHIPVILLAGAFEPVDEAMKADSGADSTLIKPFQSQDLLGAVRALLGDSAASAVSSGDLDDFKLVEDEGPDTEEEEAVVMAADVDAASMDPFAAGPAEPAEEVVEVYEAEAVEDEAYEAEEVAETFEAAMEAEAYEAEEVAEAVAEPFEDAMEVEAFEAEAAVEAEAVAEEILEGIPAPPRPAPSRPAAMDVKGALPGPAQMKEILRSAVKEAVAEALSGESIMNAVMSVIEPIVKENVEKAILDSAPVLIERVLKDSVKHGLSTLDKELENIMWETVPEMAEAMVRKEIERIKAES